MDKGMVYMQIRIEESLKAELQEAAKSVGLSLSAWIRHEGLLQARRILGKETQKKGEDE